MNIPPRRIAGSIASMAIAIAVLLSARPWNLTLSIVMVIAVGLIMLLPPKRGSGDLETGFDFDFDD